MILSERSIQNALYRDLRSASLVVAPNYTPRGWYECDVFSVTTAGYMVEHEVKLTLSDFRADAKKGHDEFMTGDGWPVPRVRRLKHDRLAAADPSGPSRFWYVVPAGLLAAADVPAWAGLKHAVTKRGWLQLLIVKQAPRLHREKCDTEKVTRHATMCMSYRYWDLRTALDREEAKAS